MLFGSSIIASIVPNKKGENRRSLGELVRRAFEDSKLTEEVWNSLPERDRDIHIVHAFHDMRAEEK